MHGSKCSKNYYQVLVPPALAYSVFSVKKLSQKCSHSSKAFGVPACHYPVAVHCVSVFLRDSPDCVQVPAHKHECQSSLCMKSTDQQFHQTVRSGWGLCIHTVWGVTHICMHACTHTHTHTHTNTHTYIRMHTHVQMHTHTHAHTHMHANTCTNTHTHTHIQMHTHTYTHTHTCTHTQTHACAQTYTHTCMCAHTHTHTHTQTHACAHTYTHTCMCTHTHTHTSKYYSIAC